MIATRRPQAWAPLLLLQFFAAGAVSPDAQCTAQRLPDDSVAMAQTKLQLRRRAEEGGAEAEAAADSADASAELQAGAQDGQRLTEAYEAASSAAGASEAAAAGNPLYWTPPKGEDPEMWKVPKDPESWAYRWGWVKPAIRMHVNSADWYHNDFAFRTNNTLEALSYSNEQAAWHPGHPGEWSKKQKEEDEKVDKEWKPIIHKENVEARKFWKKFPYMRGDGIGADALDKFSTHRKLYPNQLRPLNTAKAKKLTKKAAKKKGAAKKAAPKKTAKKAAPKKVAKKAHAKKAAAKKAAPKKKAALEEERQVSKHEERQFREKAEKAMAKLNEAEEDATGVADAKDMSKQGIDDNTDSVESIDNEIAEALAETAQQQGSAGSTQPRQSTEEAVSEAQVGQQGSDGSTPPAAPAEAAVSEAETSARREQLPTVAAAGREEAALGEERASAGADGDVAGITRADAADVRM